MKHIHTISELHQLNGFPPPENPMLSLITCKGDCSVSETEFTSDCYMIGFKKIRSGEIMYGRTKYDHDNGSMSFARPRQIIQFRQLELEENGFLLYIHEDFLHGHGLHSEIQKYHFFDYEANEALHLSPKEEETIWELYHKIETEYYNNQDEYSKGIILGHIESILRYAQRFYKRQFINRTEISGKLVSRFNESLSNYKERGFLDEKGLPNVKFMASELNLSPRYLSDLLKQETGKTAIELIHIFLISEAKNLLKADNATIAETAYSLGFENLPYFSRLFKKEVGITPNQYRKHALN